MEEQRDFKYAYEITECEDCPLYESECNGGASGGPNGPIEPPCCSWNDKDQIYDGMIESQYLAWEENYEREQKAERKVKAKKAAITRKKYAYLNEKYNKFKEWINSQSRWNLIVTSRRLNKVYIRTIGKHRANYYYNLENDKFICIQGKINYADMTLFNKIENDFIEFYTGKRPKDKNFVEEKIKQIYDMHKNIEHIFL